MHNETMKVTATLNQTGMTSILLIVAFLTQSCWHGYSEKLTWLEGGEVGIMQSKTIICLRDKIEGKTAADNHFTNSFQNLSVI